MHAKLVRGRGSIWYEVHLGAEERLIFLDHSPDQREMDAIDRILEVAERIDEDWPEYSEQIDVEFSEDEIAELRRLHADIEEDNRNLLI